MWYYALMLPTLPPGASPGGLPSSTALFSIAPLSHPWPLRPSPRGRGDDLRVCTTFRPRRRQSSGTVGRAPRVV